MFLTGNKAISHPFKNTCSDDVKKNGKGDQVRYFGFPFCTILKFSSFAHLRIICKSYCHIKEEAETFISAKCIPIVIADYVPIIMNLRAQNHFLPWLKPKNWNCMPNSMIRRKHACWWYLQNTSTLKTYCLLRRTDSIVRIFHNCPWRTCPNKLKTQWEWYFLSNLSIHTSCNATRTVIQLKCDFILMTT